MNKVRIAMLSMAHVHAGGYARQVADNPEAEMVCIWDDDPQRGKPAAEQWNVPYYEDLEAVVSRSDIEGVVVDAETSKHKEVFMAAIRHGKHIFTEKALTIKTKDADEVVRLVNESGVKFMISLPSRTMPETLFMKKVLDEKLLGDITLMRARVAHSAALDRWFSGGSAWFTNAELAGGGALFDLGCHTVDVMRWFMGEPRSLVSQVNNFSGAYPIDDNSVVTVQFKNKALGILDTGFVHRSGPNLMELYGTEGCLIRGLPGQGLLMQSRKVKAGDIEGWIQPTNLPKALPMPMQQWINAILRDEPMAITVEDGRNLTQLLEAAYIAANEGREVRF
ncbi:MAG: Gfo/Idh/MocA family oxidoreductase [Armatimonadetes bacterium]|nr:Gfo/Idh/MocA family oxidoreductase [Armatimonadota bacterium]